MPIYEYACRACGHEFEEWQKITDKAVKTCPSCKKKKVERLISQTSFHLKGGGWYGDLYAKPQTPTATAAKENGDSSKSSKSESKDSSTTTTAPDTKAATPAKSVSSPSGAASGKGATPS